MRHPIQSLIFTLAGILVLSSLGHAQFDPQDLSGVWRPGGYRGISPESPPMTARGQETFDNNKPSYGDRAIPPALGNDPTGDCTPLGLVRMLVFPRPMELIQIDNRVLQLWEWTYSRREIWTDGRDLPEDPDPRWYGYSVGRWEGDTFVVESVGHDDRTWLDQFGYGHSDQMHLEERWRRVGEQTLELTLTLTDPEMYTEPWSNTKTFEKLPTEDFPVAELREDICAPVDEFDFNERIRNPAGGLANE